MPEGSATELILLQDFKDFRDFNKISRFRLDFKLVLAKLVRDVIVISVNLHK